MPRKKQQKLCFVLMPFKDELWDVYDLAIKPAGESLGYNTIRVDKLPKQGPWNIHRKIIELIFDSDVIIADLTEWNPNVFYEMGVAHAIDNKTIMIIQRGNKLPFDVHNYNCIQYTKDEAGLIALKNQLLDFLQCIDDWKKEPTNPVQDFLPTDALVPRKLMAELEKQLKLKEKLLTNSIPIKELKKRELEISELQEQLIDQQALVKKLNASATELKQEIKNRDQQIARIQIKLDEADRKKEPEKIKTPAGMVLIPEGEFLMGTTDENFEKYVKQFGKDYQKYLAWERPAHKVKLDDFFIDKYLVTNEQFAQFLNDWKKEQDEQGNTMIYEHEWGLKKAGSLWEPQPNFEKHPVVFVTWFGATQYAKWADKQLPTEAQWEKAARGGTSFECGTRDGSISHELGNYDRKIGKTTAVGSYPANPFGLFDMSGNVWEWCLDWFADKYYEKSPPKNPVNLKEANYRVLRGGSWIYTDWYLRCANRDGDHPDSRDDNVGFRCSGAYL